MLSINTIPARSLQKSYKSIIEGVKAQKQPVILTRSGKPQAAIISLEDLNALEVTKGKQNALALLELAIESRKELKQLPADLRKKADELLYGTTHD